MFRLRRLSHGVVLLRFDVSDRALKVPRVRQLLARHDHQIPGAFVVLDADKARVRPLTYGQE